jgi:hypothetical protein
MIKNVIKPKPYILKTLALSLCMTSIFAGTALAKDVNVKAAVAQSQSTSNENAMLEKQKEIDKYLFEDHAAEIAKKGFTVTHTAPFENYVEIGITPFTQENADYLYVIFGRENVKVVESQQAQLFIGEMNTTAAVATTAAAENKKSNDSPVSMPVIYTLAGFLIVGGSVFAIGRHKASR